MFALQFTAVRAEWNRQCRCAQGLPAATSPAPRWNAVLKDWKWRVDDGLWHTPVGILKPGWMSLKSLQKAAVQSWLAAIWTKDTKTERCCRCPDGKEPVLQFQANAAVGMDYYSRRVLTGAAVDGRVTERLGSVLHCECGLRSPDREHLTFHCEAQPWDGEFRSATERRLLVPLVDAPPVLPPTWLQIHHWLLFSSNSILLSDLPWVWTAVASLLLLVNDGKELVGRFRHFLALLFRVP